MQKISSQHSYPLHSTASTRAIERLAAQHLPPHTLMQRAGLAAAQLSLALAPHARHIWVACGPGNNGGDGFVAARWLQQWGKQVTLTWTGPGQHPSPADAQAAQAQALAAGLLISAEPPTDCDFCIDALLGLGSAASGQQAASPVSAAMAHHLHTMAQRGLDRLALDIPSGLNADTGCYRAVSGTENATEFIAYSPYQTNAARTFTLSLLTLKPGLFTAAGRDAAGQVWWDDLGLGDLLPSVPPCAHLLGADQWPNLAPNTRRHASHKGSFGDVAVLGGSCSADHAMLGAALLAARAALHAGAGRVWVAPLQPGVTHDAQQAELMFCSPAALDLQRQVLVCGCGGGAAIRPLLPRVLSQACKLVLDADALNAIAQDTALQTQLAARQGRGYATVLTPHPLEAARLLGQGSSAQPVQAQRLAVAEELAARWGCVVVLKGSGTVIAAPGHTSRINPTGNALLASPGTGDVLAGMLGAAMAQGLPAFDAACYAVFQHGLVADDWLTDSLPQRLTASCLAAGSHSVTTGLKA